MVGVLAKHLESRPALWRDSQAARLFGEISCPSDAPQIRIGSLGLRMDIDFSEVTGARADGIGIDYHDGRSLHERFAHLEIPAPAKRAEWYGKTGSFFVKVRTINCGGLGNWSETISHALSDGAALPLPPPPPTPVPPALPPAPAPKPKPKCTGKCSAGTENCFAFSG